MPRQDPGEVTCEEINKDQDKVISGKLNCVFAGYNIIHITRSFISPCQAVFKWLALALILLNAMKQ